MRFTQDVGVVASTGDVRVAEKIELCFKTSAAITVGKACIVSTADTTGATVISATTALDHEIIGIYEGKGGKGAATTTTGLSGNDVGTSGEAIFVTSLGVAKILTYAVTSSSNMPINTTISFAVTAGIGTIGADPAAGLVSPAWTLEAQTGTTTSGFATICYVRYL